MLIDCSDVARIQYQKSVEEIGRPFLRERCSGAPLLAIKSSAKSVIIYKHYEHNILQPSEDKNEPRKDFSFR